MNLWHFLGDWHPKLVQFPLVLLLAGLLFDLAGLLFRSARAHWAALILTAAGTLSLLFAFICGIYAEIWAGRSGIPQHPIELHELMANIASWGFVLLFAWRILLRTPGYSAADSPQSKIENRNSKITSLYTATGLLWYLTLLLTAYLGGKLVFAYGAGITGVTPTSALTLEDLNTLASRQTDENLRYSEWMHHIFGLMTLGLAASLLAQALFPKSTPRLKWIVPAFLIAGGIFLFFKADADLYSLTDPRQWRDREVQLHKSLALIMTTIGTIGMIKLFRKPTDLEATAASEQIENRKSKIENPQSNSKLVAILALIGGALLFTHVHTVAPYANVAAGVYIAHVCLGLVALSIGATRLLQDHLPRFKKPLAVAFALFMGIESILLISYNEGLPWYIGYGTYNRWGPSHQPEDNQDRDNITVAPFGKFRAILFVNQDNGDLFVVFRDRFLPDEYHVTLDAQPQLILSRGNSEIALPLTKAIADSATPAEKAAAENDFSGSGFRTHADFVKTASFLSARLVLKMNGREHVGYFDPWVTAAVTAVPPNLVAKYNCPMHENVRTEKPGQCPLCHMELIPILPPRALNQLHDADIELHQARSQTGNPLDLQLILEPVRGDKQLRDLAIIHQQPRHLFVVSEDLTYFDHIHPIPQTDMTNAGTWLLQYHLPTATQNYFLYAQFTPTGGREQTFRIPLTNSTPKSAHLPPHPAPG
ncbi:MAG TPA: DUF2231 domain-containing protein, partial [Phycisphaerae bacterium]|nr:DUF2231 domain-containing protein [Phycisphaerae bacterium]